MCGKEEKLCCKFQSNNTMPRESLSMLVIMVFTGNNKFVLFSFDGNLTCEKEFDKKKIVTGQLLVL